MSNSKKTHSRRATSQFMKLEQRLMFDGAVVDTTLETFIPDGADMADVHQDVSGQELFASAVAYGESEKAAEEAKAQVKAFLQTASAEQLFELFNGTQEQPTQEWLDAAEALRDMILNDEFSLQVEWVGSDVLGFAKGAFAQSGLNGQPTIYLNADMAQSWLEAPELTSVLVEELGHAIDFYLNGAHDTVGDEGAEFASAVLGSDIHDTGNDHTFIDVDGSSIEVELATFTFTQIIEVDTTNGNLAEKEQETDDLGTKYTATVTVND
ncbi:MAG TPA: hypothetical protein VLA24_06510, partial [Pseudomonadales bacterium]|nr:hypothetical protein [Pseudomonadales bacterium]